MKLEKLFAAALVAALPVVAHATECAYFVTYPDAADRARFQRALSEANIPHEVQKERTCWKESAARRVAEVQTALFGPELPDGRNVRFPQGQEEFVRWLGERGLPFERVVVQGEEFIVWSAAVDAEVRKFPWLAAR